MAWPNDDLLTMAERVLQYLHHTSALRLFYSAEVATDPYLSGMSDANFSSRRSTSGYILSIANAVVPLSKSGRTALFSVVFSDAHMCSSGVLYSPPCWAWLKQSCSDEYICCRIMTIGSNFFYP
jgi:hypothetical protein